MNMPPSVHLKRVADWQALVRERAGGSHGLFDFYRDVVRALWRASLGTISNVTLEAIWDRAVFNASELHPELSDVAVGESEVRFVEFVSRAKTMDSSGIDRAFNTLFAEFMSIMARLTNGVMSERLYVALHECQPSERPSTKTAASPKNIPKKSPKGKRSKV